MNRMTLFIDLASLKVEQLYFEQHYCNEHETAIVRSRV